MPIPQTILPYTQRLLQGRHGPVRIRFPHLGKGHADAIEGASTDNVVYPKGIGVALTQLGEAC